MVENISPSVVNDVITALEKAIATTKTELTNIEETYKKKLEEAKKALSEQLEETSQQLHYWFVVRGDLPPQEKKSRRTRTKKEADTAEPQEAPTQVVDDVFPDNNEEEGAAEPETPTDAQEETSVTSVTQERVESKMTEVPFPEETGNLWPEESKNEESDEPGEPEPINPFEENESDWNNNSVEENVTDQPEEDENESVLGEDGWPVEPKEWQ